MRLPLLSTLAVAGLLAVPLAAGAQTAGRVEGGLFGMFTKFDDLAQADDAAGGGARLGIYIARNVILEGEFSVSPTTSASTFQGGDLRFTPFIGRLAWHMPLGSDNVGLTVGAGWGVMHFGRESMVASAANFIAGPRIRFSDRGALRINGFVDQFFGNAWEFTNTQKNATNVGVQVGLSWIFGGSQATPTEPAPQPAPPVVTPTPAPTPPPAPADADNDGVLDANDRCAATPAGTTVDANGCPPPADADRDGVPDDRDRCANTAAGATVNAEGCEPAPTPPPAPVDADNDGIPDATDRCLGTSAGTRVDATGCAVIFTDTTRTLTLRGVNFATGLAELTPESRGILDDVAASLVANAEVRVEVAGHTDNTGSAATNTRLSAARAAAVRQYLVGKGVAADRLTARGYGPSVPVAANTTVEGRAQNRRVELRRLD